MIVRTTTVTEVKLDHEAVEEVFRQVLDSMCGGDHVYIDEKTGKVMSWDDTGHGSGITDEVKNPTVTQVAALKFRETLNEVKRLAAVADEKKRHPLARRRAK